VRGAARRARTRPAPSGVSHRRHTQQALPSVEVAIADRRTACSPAPMAASSERPGGPVHRLGRRGSGTARSCRHSRSRRAGRSRRTFTLVPAAAILEAVVVTDTHATARGHHRLGLDDRRERRERRRGQQRQQYGPGSWPPASPSFRQRRAGGRRAGPIRGGTSYQRQQRAAYVIAASPSTTPRRTGRFRCRRRAAASPRPLNLITPRTSPRSRFSRTPRPRPSTAAAPPTASCSSKRRKAPTRGRGSRRRVWTAMWRWRVPSKHWTCERRSIPAVRYRPRLVWRSDSTSACTAGRRSARTSFQGLGGGASWGA